MMFRLGPLWVRNVPTRNRSLGSRASLPMDGQECANSGLMQRSPAGKSLGQT
jgi:hypothetical protein